MSASHRETVASFVDVEPTFRADIPDRPRYWLRARSSRPRTTFRIAREEVFGPVAAVIPFDDEADAIRIWNDTPYGLSGSIWTREPGRELGMHALDGDSEVKSVFISTEV